MDAEQLAAIRERYTLALNAKPSKGAYTEKGITALTDSVCDVPELLREIDRLNATIQRVWELSHEWSVSIPCDAVIDLDIEIVQPLVRTLEGGEQND